MKHRYMERNIYIGGKGNFSGAFYEVNKCHMSHTVNENIRAMV